MQLPASPDASGFQLVFDASQKAPDWWFPAFGLIFVAAGICLFVFRPQLTRFGFWQRSPRAYKIFSTFFLGFALLWTTLSSVGVFGSWYWAQHADRTQVEGAVENFHAMPYTGHDEEHFTVDGVYFAYSNFEVSPGFNTTSSYGGPIRAGLEVRIWYASLLGQRTILRLEVRH